jgi:O-6-methylguanine DNA methyltransferase
MIFAQPQNQSHPKLRAFVRGTPFQLRVPAGSLTSYGQLSAAIGSPGASRAVGSAVGANPIAFIIPCHRVIRETGLFGNYRWDPIRKRAMIGWEISARSSLQRGTNFQSVGRSGFQPNPHSRRQDARLPHRQDACATQANAA